MEFGYARVSTNGQNPERQITSLLEYGIPRKRIYVEKETGSFELVSFFIIQFILQNGKIRYFHNSHRKVEVLINGASVFGYLGRKHNVRRLVYRTVDKHSAVIDYRRLRRRPFDSRSVYRIRQIDMSTDGFIYMVSSAATTGVQSSFAADKQKYFERIAAMNLKNPRLIGFGISNRETFDSACRNASGAIIGSQFVKLLAEKTLDEAVSRLLEMIGRK